jgi:hypothetical protein
VSVSTQSESNYVAAAAYIENVNQIRVLSHGVWFGAARRDLVSQPKTRAMHEKHGNFSATSIHREEKIVVLTEGQRPLRLQGVGHTPGATATGRESAALLQRAVCRAGKRNDLVPIDGIGHNEDCAGRGWLVILGTASACGH